MPKNKSQKYPNGTIVQTRDEFLQRRGSSRRTPYSDANHPNPRDYYRTTVVVDSNRKNELALVKKTTHSGRSPKGTYSERIEVRNFKNKPIKIGSYFKVSRKRLSKKETSDLRKRVFKTGSFATMNRHLVHTKIKKRGWRTSS